MNNCWRSRDALVKDNRICSRDIYPWICGRGYCGDKVKGYYNKPKPINSDKDIQLNDIVKMYGIRLRVGGIMDIDIKGKLTRVVSLYYKVSSGVVRFTSKQEWLHVEIDC